MNRALRFALGKLAMDDAMCPAAGGKNYRW
jgi:hypothetical protein